MILCVLIKHWGKGGKKKMSSVACRPDIVGVVCYYVQCVVTVSHNLLTQRLFVYASLIPSSRNKLIHNEILNN